MRGVRVVTNVGPAMRWTLLGQARGDMRTTGTMAAVKSCGPGIPVLMPSLRCFDEQRGRRGQERRSPGRSRISWKTIAQGRPGCLGRACGSAACFFSARGPWERQAPGLPCALCYSRGSNELIARAHRVARMRRCDSARLHPLVVMLRACGNPARRSFSWNDFCLWNT